MIALADYGASNTRSVLRALLAAGADAPTLTDDPATLRRAGRVVRFQTELPVPHVGWARVRLTAGGKAHGALAGAFDGDEAFFYHVHSYHPVGVDATGALAEAEYGGPFPTIVGAGNVLGVQFHPEKSQAAGLALLRAFTRWTP